MAIPAKMPSVRRGATVRQEYNKIKSEYVRMRGFTYVLRTNNDSLEMEEDHIERNSTPGQETGAIALNQLRQTLLARIDEYLQGDGPNLDIATWAAQTVATTRIPSHSYLLYQGLRELILAGQIHPSLYSSDLNKLKLALEGKTDYTVTFRIFRDSEPSKLPDNQTV